MQIDAAIGREFSYQLLRAVSPLRDEELQASLARLVASELVFQRGTPPEAVYSFKHTLVQDAAHGSLLRSARQQLHAQIAEALEMQSPERIESQPELFAQHYAEAELVEKSVAYWGKAGHRSAARWAMAEAGELRAAASLARLCRDRGRHAEARDLLAPAYCWFTEGFDTADLNEAKALLDELTWSGRQHARRSGANDCFLVNSTIRWRGREGLLRGNPSHSLIGRVAADVRRKRLFVEITGLRFPFI